MDLAEGFNCQFPFPIDINRMRVSDLNGRNDIPMNARWVGMVTFVNSEQKYYALLGGTDNTKWVELVVTGAPLQSVTYSTNVPDTEGQNGDIWFRNNSAGGLIELYYKASGGWGLLGTWSNGGASTTHTPDPSLPDPPTNTYLNTNYPTAKPGDTVYWEGTTQLVTATCYAVGEWKWITENRAT